MAIKLIGDGRRTTDLYVDSYGRPCVTLPDGSHKGLAYYHEGVVSQTSYASTHYVESSATVVSVFVGYDVHVAIASVRSMYYSDTYKKYLDAGFRIYTGSVSGGYLQMSGLSSRFKSIYVLAIHH